MKSENVGDVVDIINNVSVSRITFFTLFILITVIATIYIILKLGSKTVSKFDTRIDSIGLGKLAIKTSKKVKEFDIDMFFNVLNLLLTNEIQLIITKTIGIINDVRDIDDEYNDNVRRIFMKNFSNISSGLYTSFSKLINKKGLNEDEKMINNLFIKEMMTKYEHVWKKQMDDIINRNGFINFVSNSSKFDEYVYELITSVYQCINVESLETTNLTIQDIEEIVNSTSNDSKTLLYKMFMLLADLKGRSIEKQNNKLKLIDLEVEGVVKKIMTDVEAKLINSSEESSVIKKK